LLKKENEIMNRHSASKNKGCGITREFIVSRKARETYGFQSALFKLSGGEMFTDFQAVRQFAQQLKDELARPGHINAMGILHEVFHHVIHLYQADENPGMMEKAGQWLESRVSKDAMDNALKLFVQEFPPDAVFNGDISAEAYVEGHSEGVPHRHLLLEELMLLWLSNINPAQAPYREDLFHDGPLAEKSSYSGIIEQLEIFFQSQPFFGPGKQNLFALLRSPAVSVPESLPGQLRYIRDRWGTMLGDFLDRLLSGLDLIKEEEKFGGLGPGDTPVLDFSGLGEEYERFTADLHWMPRLVLIAKSTHVWLDQLSKTYNRPIQRLDQVPDEELDVLARRGFTGLWLIGLWERSKASERIKQLCGNPEAMASAYSIYQYRIADNLGGEDAMNNLRRRACRRGIRMASDMVPNHMGIDSPWLVEHPDWFLSLPYCPYPNYTFNGPNLSSDGRAGIYLEDHYYDRTDAAVVFKWVSHQNGEVRYIYHGNDGTAMPWNDTAQLDYLNPEVREAVIDTIFSVAHGFPVIRFDAAMTLTKKHYQRLWFPEPGSGGDIPTRAGKGMDKEEFLQHMPHEFWRQVVDRFSEAGSDTLLLAEAFWLMEAYFVRTLGMHRVYNSAFMNFLKNEDNAQFRASIKNVLKFNPEILKRFVNFMNNPDEETAAAQFGKDDKYFGACTLMATLPGLPMFGHGQVEGFEEKYGMEYRKAYRDETPEPHLLERHDREIFPLLNRRFLFAEVKNFLLYDFHTGDGHTDENVIAYSNYFDGKGSLVLVHNTFSETAGWIHTSAPFTLETGAPPLRRSLVEGLRLTPAENRYVIFRDQPGGLEYIRNCKELAEKGLYVELKAFKKNVFLDFREVSDGEDHIYARLAEMLNGKGVPSINDTLRQHFFNPLKSPFQNLLLPDLYGGKSRPPRLAAIEEKLALFLEAVQNLTGAKGDAKTIAATRIKQLEQALEALTREKEDFLYFKPFIISYHILEALTALLSHPEEPSPHRPWSLLEDWLLNEELQRFMAETHLPPETADRLPLTLELMISVPQWRNLFEPGREFPVSLFNHPLFHRLMQVNRHEDELWFHKESAEQLFQLLSLVYAAGLAGAEKTPGKDTIDKRIHAAFKESGYKLDALAALLSG
jgi:glycosidase